MALCLTRRTGQKIIVDGPCEIEVRQVLKGKVRLAIQAPRDVEIVRGELLTGMEPIPFHQTGENKRDDAAAA